MRRVCVLQQSCDKRQQPISAPGSPCLPEGWNSSSDVYALQYRHEKTGGTCLVKAIPIEGELLLNATVFKSAETVHTVSLATSKYVREEPGGQFNSPRVFQNLLQLMGLLNKNIVHKLETVLTSHRDPHRPQQDTRTQEDPLIKSTTQQQELVAVSKASWDLMAMGTLIDFLCTGTQAMEGE
eukprot:Em0074g19a